VNLIHPPFILILTGQLQAGGAFMTKEEFAVRIVAMQESLYRVSYSILQKHCDQEDAVQEAIQKAWQQRGKLREDAAMQQWVTRILINECYALLRRRKREVPVESLPDRETPPDADIALNELFLSLDEPLRLPAVLHYIEGYELKDIARMLRLPAGTVKSRLYRARIKMKETWDGQEVCKV
jgi:RNA polymerase sigma-70 factor (ECF subfamily)